MTLRQLAASCVFATCGVAAPPAHSQGAEPRLRDVVYDAKAVVTVPVKQGVVTHIALDADEVITEVGTGIGSDCSKQDSAWCVAAQAGGRHLFIKPKSTASAPNNLAVVTDRRTHAFRLVLVGHGETRAPVYRLTVRAAVVPPPVRAVPLRVGVGAAEPPSTAASAAVAAAESVPAAQVVAERLAAKPQVVNTDYSLAEGEASADIVPTMVFDDGRFTYLRFPGNREVPAVFHVLGDGSETLVNTRMEDELLVVDRVSRRLMLRAGTAVVGIWNEAFDAEGAPPVEGTTVPGVRRVQLEPAAKHHER